MRELTKIENWIFRITGLGLSLSLISFQQPHEKISLAVYTVCALCFLYFICRMRYEGTNITLRRLRRQQIMGALCLVLLAVARAMQVFQFGSLRRNEWIVFFAIGAMLNLYTTWRIAYILEKENREGRKERNK